MVAKGGNAPSDAYRYGGHNNEKRNRNKAY